jgi:hypothetical protein
VKHIKKGRIVEWTARNMTALLAKLDDRVSARGVRRLMNQRTRDALTRRTRRYANRSGGLRFHCIRRRRVVAAGVSPPAGEWRYWPTRGKALPIIDP